MIEDHKPVEVDPDFFDVLIQSLSVLSNIATMAAPWIVVKQEHGRQHSDQVTDAIRNQLRGLRRNLEDCFDAVENILRILEQAHGRTGADLMQQKPRFGAGVLLHPEELSQASQHLNVLDLAALQGRQAARNIQGNMLMIDLPGTDNIDFDVDVFTSDLNSILFDSPSFAEAMAKLRSANQRAEDFINAVYVALRRN